jgi:hypothetical protein
MAQPVWAPPHPVAVFRLLKQAFRAYMASGNACSIDVTTPPNQLATATTPVAGTVWVSPGVPLPATVSVSLKQGATTKGTQTANVNLLSGVYSTTFPANTLVAATPASATVVSASPVDTTTTPTFTVS